MIPVNEPWIADAERRYVAECMEAGWISSAGPYVGRFEQAWADYCGVEHGVAVSSGTAALFAAVSGLGLVPGDEVIVPTFTIVSCVHAILACDAIPVLVDCEPDTWCMSSAQVAERVTPRTRAIMAVHMYGHPVDIAPLWELARQHDLRIVEDAAEAHGATYDGRRTGSLGDVGCFSFYANKIVTTGEGGMVVTDDEDLARAARSYRDLAFRTDRRFFHTEVGYNHRLTNVQAAIGFGQVENIGERVERKREVGRLYTERLSDLSMLQLPVEKPGTTNVYWMYGVVIDESTGMDAGEFARRLLEVGIDTRPFFIGMHEQPVFLEQGLFESENYPVAERIARQGLYLPSGLALTNEQIDQVCAGVRKVVGS